MYEILESGGDGFHSFEKFQNFQKNLTIFQRALSNKLVGTSSRTKFWKVKPGLHWFAKFQNFQKLWTILKEGSRSMASSRTVLSPQHNTRYRDAERSVKFYGDADDEEFSGAFVLHCSDIYRP